MGGRIEVIVPENKLRIDEVWMVVSVDEKGDEGVCSAPFPGTLGNIHMPLIAADEDRLPFIRQWAQVLANQIGSREIKLIKLGVRTEVETFEKELL